MRGSSDESLLQPATTRNTSAGEAVSSLCKYGAKADRSAGMNVVIAGASKSWILNII